MTHVSGNEKILHPGGRKLILFNQFSGHILCPSLVSFAFLILVFFVCLFDVFLNQKCIFWYPFEYLTKTFSPGRFPETWLLFLALTHFFKYAINICELHYLEFDSFLHRKMKRNNCPEHCSWFSDLNLCNQFWNY